MNVRRARCGPGVINFRKPCGANMGEITALGTMAVGLVRVITLILVAGVAALLLVGFEHVRSVSLGRLGRIEWSPAFKPAVALLIVAEAGFLLMRFAVQVGWMAPAKLTQIVQAERLGCLAGVMLLLVIAAMNWRRQPDAQAVKIYARD